jgi:hypothetical protein
VHFCSPVFLTPLPISLCLKDELSERKASPSGKFPVTRLSRNLSDKLSGINK